MNENLSYSPAGYALTKSFEGLQLKAYADPGGVITIGYGHTGNVKIGDVITEEEADALLRADIAAAERNVRSQIMCPLSQGQYDALVDWVFNLGGGALHDSTLRKKLNAGDYDGAAEEFGKWIYQGKTKLPGLEKRRAAETVMFTGEAQHG